MAAVTCATCGEPFELDAAAFTFAPLIRWAESAIAGEMEAFCPRCAGESAERSERAEAHAERLDLMLGRLRRSGIPESLRVAFTEIDRTENEVRRRAAAAAGVWAKTGGGLLLTGPVGVGKTFIAGAAATAATWHRRVRWRSVARLLTDLRGGFGSPAYEEALRALSTAGGYALILDDLDKVKPTEHSLQPLYLAIDAWTQEELPLLVTMNRDLDELERDWGAFGPPVASRLEGYCRIARLTGRDRRAAA